MVNRKDFRPSNNSSSMTDKQRETIKKHNPKNRSWNVYENGKFVDRVHYNGDIDKEDVRHSLINHDGYSNGITLREDKQAFNTSATSITKNNKNEVQTKGFDRDLYPSEKLSAKEIIEREYGYSKNMMTPTIISRGKTMEGAYELSEGRGFDNDKIYGVSVVKYDSKTGKTTRDEKHSQMYHTKIEAISHINNLKNHKGKSTATSDQIIYTRPNNKHRDYSKEYSGEI